MIDIDTILKNRLLVSYFQPLVSIKKKAVIGFEALIRGVDPETGALVPPYLLFDLASAQGRGLELDRLCRDAAFSRFKDFHLRERSLLLSVNLDVRILDTEAAGSKYLLGQTEKYGIDPNNVIIEIIEADVNNSMALLEFSENYRNHGFIIAIDDVGAGHSNLERITSIKPDVLKIDRSLISDIDTGYHKREVVKSLCTLGRKIGALVVAEGVEREQEAVALMELGADIFQGFFFARPQGPEYTQSALPPAVVQVADVFKEYMLKKISSKRGRFAVFNTLISELAARLAVTPTAAYDRTLVEFLSRQPEFECLYVLDLDGTQASNTVCNPYSISENRRFIYQPAQRGADHSLKEYFLPIKAGLPRYTTEEYTSLASGNRCITIAAVFPAAEGHAIVCVDIASQEEV